MQLVQISCSILLQDRLLHFIDCWTVDSPHYRIGLKQETMDHFDQDLIYLKLSRPIGERGPSESSSLWSLSETWKKAFFGFGAGILIPAAYIIFGNLTDTFVDFGFYGNCQNSEVLLWVIDSVKSMLMTVIGIRNVSDNFWNFCHQLRKTSPTIIQ